MFYCLGPWAKGCVPVVGNQNTEPTGTGPLLLAGSPPIRATGPAAGHALSRIDCRLAHLLRFFV